MIMIRNHFCYFFGLQQSETAPEWVAVASSKLRYYARVVTERAETMDVQFLYPRGNDIYAFKKSRTTETIESRQVFARNLKLTIKGEGYSVMGEKEVRLKYAEHVKKMAPLLKVINKGRHFDLFQHFIANVTE